ncbi:glycosyltransferase family 9 protein [Skermania sp. ID1734]|uniref:glycosyltransferase family 9 protein n=1 Tax=Skermania sp. ID1734 TaxID=2597516 RepID=UPI00117DFDFC|nr:glycosyltransferase family 9 protein [Skermania sp. ID1734]TSD99479.1 glycosyltransferase family 9 protein [Skermania sp. ID1734]
MTLFDTDACAIGPVCDKFPDVGAITVVRGGGIGDVLSAEPALAALAAAYPGAQITLMCEPGTVALFRGRMRPVHRVVGLPAARGVYEPPGQTIPDDVPRSQLPTEPIDLGVQVHGGGRWSNRFLNRMNPVYTVGTKTPDAEALTRWLAYRRDQHEVLRWLEVAGLAGAPPVRLQPRMWLAPNDYDEAQPVLRWCEEKLVVLHPGARDPRRRWPPQCFADVASRLVRDGYRVAVIGAPTEQPLVDEVVNRTGDLLPAVLRGYIRGFTGLGYAGMCGALAAAAVVLANDSGPRHVARAFGTPTVGIFWIVNMLTVGPLGRFVDRARISWRTDCPVCGTCADPDAAQPCSHSASFVSDIDPVDVYRDATELLTGHG